MDEKHVHDCDCGCDCCDHDCGDGEFEVITLTDEEGNAVDFSIVDAVEHNGTVYLELVETAHIEDDECEFIILKSTVEGDEGVLVTIDNEDEFNTVLALFDEKAEAAGEFDIEAVDEEG